jgi:hypothetical protein
VEYHVHLAEVPKLPPVKDKVVEAPEPEHINEEVELNEVGGWERMFTVTVVLTQDVVLQEPSALAKNFVVEVGFHEMPDPVPSRLLPQEPEYQYQFAPVPKEPPEILNVTEFPEQITGKFDVADWAATEKEFTVTVVLTHVVVLPIPSART